MDVLLSEGETFPEGRTFTVMVERLNVQSFKGEDIFPKAWGCFFRIPASDDRDERLAFWPWQRIVRMYEV
ncbi:MAG TPA: hypothetical protein VIY48_12805 [Candidatus Paceibacterota bacterium]